MRKTTKISIAILTAISLVICTSLITEPQIRSAAYWKRISGSLRPTMSTNSIGASGTRVSKIWLDDLDSTSGTIGTLTISSSSAGDITIKKADPALILDTTTATDTDFWIGVTEDAGGDDDDILQIGDGTTPGTNPFLTIDTSGQVGIGTAAPGSLLELSSPNAGAPVVTLSNAGVDASSSVLILQNSRGGGAGSDGDDGGIIRFKAQDSASNLTTYITITGEARETDDAGEAGTFKILALHDEGTPGSIEMIGIRGGTQVGPVQGNIVLNGDSKDVDFDFRTSVGSGSLFVEGSSGNVGIGETTPDYPLEILSATTPQFAISNDDGNDYATLAVSTAGLLTITTVDQAAAAANIVLAPDGVVTISSVDLYVTATNSIYFDGGTETYISETSADVMDVYVGAAQMLTLTEAASNYITTQVGTVYTPSGDQARLNDSTITIDNTIVRVAGSGGAVILDTNPAIEDGATDGQMVIIQGTSDANTVQIADAVNTALAGAAAFTLGDGDTIMLIWDSGLSLWLETSRSDN